MLADSGIDFQAIGIVLAGISFALIGLTMAGSALFPEQAQRYQKNFPVVLGGLVLLGVSGAIMAAIGG